MTADDPAILEIGRIGRPHGLRGELSVNLVTDQTEARTAPGAVWLVGPERTEMVVTTARPHQNRWLVMFDGFDDRTAVEPLRGLVCYAEALEDPEVVFVHDVVGRSLTDQHGQTWGDVVAVVANPASDLMELADGSLVPMAFYVDHDDATVRVDVPDGLLGSLD